MAQSFWPGQSIRTNVPSDTGAVDFWQKAAESAAEAGKVFEDWYLENEQNKFSTSQVQVAAEETKLANALNDEMDPEKFDGIGLLYETKFQKLRPEGDGPAAQAFDLAQAKQRIVREQSVHKAKGDRTRVVALVNLDIAEQQFIETFIGTNFLEQAESYIFLRPKEEAVIRRRVEKATATAERDEALRRIKRDPEGYLDSLKKGSPPILEDLPTVSNDPGKMQEMRNNALGYIDAERIEKGRLTLTQTARIKKAGTDLTVDMDDYRKKVWESDGLSNEQKENAWNLFTQSRGTMARGGSNAYTTTENWILYGELRVRAANKAITKQEIFDNVGPGGISWPKAEGLIKIIDGKDSSAKAFEDSGAAENLTAQIDAFLPTGRDEDRIDVALNQFATQRGLGLLEDAIENNPDWTDREKKEEALRIGQRLEREENDGTLELGMEAAINISSPELFSKLKPSEFERPVNSLDEIEKLAPGTVFFYQGKKYTRN